MTNILIDEATVKLALEAFSVIAISDNFDWIQHQAEQQAATLREALAEQPAQQEPEANALYFGQWTAADKDLSDYICVGSLTLAGIEDGEYGQSESNLFENTIEALQERLVTGTEHKKVPLLAYIGALNITPQPAHVQEPVAFIDTGKWPPIRWRDGVIRKDLARFDGQGLFFASPPAPAAQQEPVPTECRRDGRCQYVIDLDLEGQSLGFPLLKPTQVEEPTKAMIDAAERIDWSDSDVRGNIVNMWQAMCAVAPQVQPAPPAQRKPLTDEQITAIDDAIMKSPRGYCIKFARAIEAAHNIKEENT